MREYTFTHVDVTLKYKKIFHREHINGNANFTDWVGSAPNLTTIKRYAIFNGWSGSAPNLKEVDGRRFSWKKEL